MYALEITTEFRRRAKSLHPKRYKQIHLHIFSLQQNPHPTTAVIVDIETYRLRVGPYLVTYKVDDAARRVQLLFLEEVEKE
ncbi:MAG TPA: hypothetical protein VFD70_22940 [Anaerolineae bacterium]|nr:hypothetical protein [Anaerolineae bacterium]